MPDTMADRRRAVRYALVLVVEVTEIATGAKMVARTSDLSRTGCYIDTLNPAPKESPLRLRLTNSGDSIELTGVVRYVSPRLGMGVEFTGDVPVQTLDAWCKDASVVA